MGADISLDVDMLVDHMAVEGKLLTVIRAAVEGFVNDLHSAIRAIIGEVVVETIAISGADHGIFTLSPTPTARKLATIRMVFRILKANAKRFGSAGVLVRNTDPGTIVTVQCGGEGSVGS